VCFTYGTWFGVRGLRAAGAQDRDPALRRACEFLYHRQNADGGWGESGASCRERRYIASASHAVNTAWALLTLVAAAKHETHAASVRPTSWSPVSSTMVTGPGSRSRACSTRPRSSTMRTTGATSPSGRWRASRRLRRKRS